MSLNTENIFQNVKMFCQIGMQYIFIYLNVHNPHAVYLSIYAYRSKQYIHVSRSDIDFF